MVSGPRRSRVTSPSRIASRIWPCCASGSVSTRFSTERSGAAARTRASAPTSSMPWEALPKAQAAAMRALEINPQLAEGHAALAYANAHFLWDWKGAERQLCRALTLNPDYPHAHHWYSHLTMALGRVDESLHWSMR